MAEPIEIIDPPVPEIQDDDFGVDIMDDVPQKDEATLALEEKIAQLEREREALAQRASQAPIDESFAKLAEQLARMQTPAQPSAPPKVQPHIDPEALVEKVNKSFYDNPAASVMTLLDPIIRNMQSTSESQNAQRDLDISRLSILADDSTKSIYSKYKDEIENAVKSRKPSQTVYRDALNEVRMNHFEDFVSEAAAKRMEEATLAAQAQAQAAPQPTVSRTFTNATQVQQKPPAPTGGPKIYRDDIPKVREWMLVKGMPWESKDDRDWAIEYLREKGAIK